MPFIKTGDFEVTHTGSSIDYSSLETLGFGLGNLYVTWSGQRTHHILTGVNVIVDGDLVVDGANHNLSITADSGDALVVSGLYEITTEHENSGFIDSISADVLSVRNTATTNNMRALYVQGSGLFKMKGGVAHLYTDSNHSLRTQDGASVHATDCTLLMNKSLRLHNSGSDTRFNNVVYRANATALTRAPTEWNNVRALQGSLTPVTTPDWDNVGWSPLQINSQYTNWNNEIIFLTDAQNGMRHQLRAGLIKTDGGSVTVVRKRFNISVRNPLGLPAGEDVFVWIKSPDNGNRFDYQQAYLSRYNTTDDVIDVYNLDGDGNTGVQYYNYRIGRSVEGGSTNHVMQNDFYTKSTSTGEDAEAKIDMKVVGYYYNFLSLSDVDMIGGGVLDVDASLVFDTRISTPLDEIFTQTRQNNVNEAYDGLKIFRVLNYNDEDNPIVGISGTVLEAGDYDVIVDGDGEGLPQFDGQIITLFSSSFTDDIRTTGEVIGLENIRGSVFDVNGDSVINITTPAGYNDSIRVYQSLADAEAETNEVASGQSIRYQSAAFGGATLFFRAETADGIPAFGSHVIPFESGVFSVNVATTSENSALGQILILTTAIEENQKVLNRNIKKASLSIPANEEI